MFNKKYNELRQRIIQLELQQNEMFMRQHRCDRDVYYLKGQVKQDLANILDELNKCKKQPKGKRKCRTK